MNLKDLVNWCIIKLSRLDKHFTFIIYSKITLIMSFINIYMQNNNDMQNKKLSIFNIIFENTPLIDFLSVLQESIVILEADDTYTIMFEDTYLNIIFKIYIEMYNEHNGLLGTIFKILLKDSVENRRVKYLVKDKVNNLEHTEIICTLNSNYTSYLDLIFMSNKDFIEPRNILTVNKP